MFCVCVKQAWFVVGKEGSVHTKLLTYSKTQVETLVAKLLNGIQFRLEPVKERRDM